MTIVTSLLNGGICEATYTWIEDLASVTGGAGYSYAFLYVTFLILLVLFFTIVRNEIIGTLAGIFGFSLIGIAGGAGCLPIPTAIVTISVVIGLIITLFLFFLYKFLR